MRGKPELAAPADVTLRSHRVIGPFDDAIRLEETVGKRRNIST